jgi:hypothetical protein
MVAWMVLMMVVVILIKVASCHDNDHGHCVDVCGTCDDDPDVDGYTYGDFINDGPDVCDIHTRGSDKCRSRHHTDDDHRGHSTVFVMLMITVMTVMIIL